MNISKLPMMLLYKVYFFITAFGIVHTIKRFIRLYRDGQLLYGRCVISRKALETLLAFILLGVHFWRICYLLQHTMLPEGFRMLWFPETLYFVWYIRGVVDEKHYAAIEKALHKAFSAID